MTLHFRNVLKCSQVSSRGDELSALKTETMSPEAQGARGSQGANQVCHRFNSFVLCLIGCWARLGFLWPQLETSVKRLDGHSESVNCFQQSAFLTVPLFPKSRPVPCLTIYLAHEVFTESCISRPLVCIMPVFVTTGATAALLRQLLNINSPVFTQDRIEPAPLFLFLRHHQPAGPRPARACLELWLPGFALVQLLSDLRQDYTKASF